MGKPAARISDNHTCPMVNGTVPHVGGPIVLGSANVFTGGQAQARIGDMLVCNGPPDTIAQGSSGVFVNGKPAARLSDATAHGGVIVTGLPTVLIGDSGGGGTGGASLAFVALETQLKSLIAAAMSGAPFCEICFQKALANFERQTGNSGRAAASGAGAAVKGLLSQPAGMAEDAANLVSEAALNQAERLIAGDAANAVQRALDAGLTPETAELYAEDMVRGSERLVGGARILGDIGAFAEAAIDVNEVVHTSDYTAKVGAASKAFAAISGGTAGVVSGWVVGGAATAIGVAVGSPVLVPAAIVVGVGAVAIGVGSWAWDRFADRPFRNYYLGPSRK